jgi:predicted RNA binding protein YcfA (HicA-like mRNA interferase family)
MDKNLTVGYTGNVTWAEVIRKLRAAGFVEQRKGKGAHVLYRHPDTGRQVWVTVHAKQDCGHLGDRILREAGVK